MGETGTDEREVDIVVPKKVVGRTVVLGLAIVCVLLIAVLGGVVAYYTMRLNERDSEIDSINAQLASIVGNNSNANATEMIILLNSRITNLVNETNQLLIWLSGNKTLLSKTQGWLNDNVTAYNNFAANHTYTNAEYQNLQTRVENLTGQVNHLNSQITSLQNEITSLQAPNLIKINFRTDDNRPSPGTSYLHVYGEVCNLGVNTAYNGKLHVVANQSGDVSVIDTYIPLGAISGQSWTSVDSSLTYSGSSLTSWSVTLQWTASP